MNLGISQNKPIMSQRNIFNIKYDCEKCKRVINQNTPCGGKFGSGVVFYPLKCSKIKK